MEFAINMELQIGVGLPKIHSAQLVYLNHRDLCSNFLHWKTTYWLDQNFTKRTVTIKNNKTVAVPILNNTYVQFN